MTFSTPSWEADHPLFEREDKGELRIELKRKKEGAYIGTLVATYMEEGLQGLQGGPSIGAIEGLKRRTSRGTSKKISRKTLQRA